MASPITVLELCAGAGGMALGFEQAGFEHAALVDNDADACRTLRHNRPHWRVVEGDINAFDAKPYQGVDFVAAGLPCPPFSVGGKQLGEADERNLFPPAFRIIEEVRPKAIIIENVPGLLAKRFEDYREMITGKLDDLGYVTRFELLKALDFGVPQRRERVFIIALRPTRMALFQTPKPDGNAGLYVGDTLFDLMAARGWLYAEDWRQKAQDYAPTISCGSKLHGGADLGGTRGKHAWLGLSTDGFGVADAAPGPHGPAPAWNGKHKPSAQERRAMGLPMLTPRMIARLQGFPDAWHFCGRKTSMCRQIGNALPAPMACAVGWAVAAALREILRKEAA